jgi:hypothetical protein
VPSEVTPNHSGEKGGLQSALANLLPRYAAPAAPLRQTLNDLVAEKWTIALTVRFWPILLKNSVYGMT